MKTADVQELALFQTCRPEDLQTLADATPVERTIADGATICVEGESADRWSVVVEGVADVTVDGLYTATIGP